MAGLLTGTLTGTICHGTMFAVIALRMDWPAEAERAMQRVGAGVLPTLNGGVHYFSYFLQKVFFCSAFT